jgi:hypothetical protein
MESAAANKFGGHIIWLTKWPSALALLGHRETRRAEDESRKASSWLPDAEGRLATRCGLGMGRSPSHGGHGAKTIGIVVFKQTPGPPLE